MERVYISNPYFNRVQYKLLIMVNKNKTPGHLYSERIVITTFYTYNNKYEKVYDIKSIKNDFKEIISSLK